VSLDVGLFLPYTTIDGEHKRIHVFERNVTHNLALMARAVGIHKACWRPDEIGYTHARDLVPALEAGLARLEGDGPDAFREYEPENGWGTWSTLCAFVEAYLDACREYPDAEISVSR